MSTFVECSGMPWQQAVMRRPTQRRNWDLAFQPWSLQALPSDAVGNFVLTLTNLIVGSAIQIQAADGTPLHNETAASTAEVINLQAYAAGSPLNDLRIKVRKGSTAPFYRPFQTQALAFKGAQSIFISQIPDE